VLVRSLGLVDRGQRSILLVDDHLALGVGGGVVALIADAYIWFAIGPSGVVFLAPAFVLAGLGIGCAETAEHAAVAELAQGDSWIGSGLLAAIQSVRNLAASTIAGILWTAASPAAAFVFLAAAMTIAVAANCARRRSSEQRT